MANLRIYLEAVKVKGKYQLKLSDSEGNTGIDNLTSRAKRGFKVKWEKKRHPEIKIKDISKIGAKDGTDDIFGKSLKKVGQNWVGRVKHDAAGKKEDYFIYYYVKGEDKEQMVDPVIIVDSEDDDEQD